MNLITLNAWGDYNNFYLFCGIGLRRFFYPQMSFLLADCGDGYETASAHCFDMFFLVGWITKRTFETRREKDV